MWVVGTWIHRRKKGCFHTIYGDIQILFGIHPAVSIDDLSQTKVENRTKGVENILFALNIFPAFDYLCRWICLFLSPLLITLSITVRQIFFPFQIRKLKLIRSIATFRNKYYSFEIKGNQRFILLHNVGSPDLLQNLILFLTPCAMEFAFISR